VFVIGQDRPQVGAVRPERGGPMTDAVLGQLAHDGRHAVHDGDRQPHEDLPVGLPGDRGQPPEGLRSAVPRLDLLAAQAVRPDRPEE
jgi:hypothetical protein